MFFRPYLPIDQILTFPHISWFVAFFRCKIISWWYLPSSQASISMLCLLFLRMFIHEITWLSMLIYTCLPRPTAFQRFVASRRVQTRGYVDFREQWRAPSPTFQCPIDKRVDIGLRHAVGRARSESDFTRSLRIALRVPMFTVQYCKVFIRKNKTITTSKFSVFFANRGVQSLSSAAAALGKDWT